MIWESWYWKQPLIETAQRFKKLKNVAEPTEDQLVQLEKDIFIGFYSIRKLFEAVTKVTDATRKSTLQLSCHPNRRPVTWRTSHKIDELYDLKSDNLETRDVWFICSRIIHSFIFAPEFDGDEKLINILFTSDNDKNKRLYALSIDQVIDLFELVGNDYPNQILSCIDPIAGNEKTIVE
jgi:hypothetical protein